MRLLICLIIGHSHTGIREPFHWRGETYWGMVRCLRCRRYLA